MEYRPLDYKNKYKILIESSMEIRPSTFDRLSPTDQMRMMGMSEGYEEGYSAAVEHILSLLKEKARSSVIIDILECKR
ncbi:hypothetical protein LCGC14_1439740 [marine sediment metagenome]|uniref:Uncharacterized protein n=1 Tax=marine sediment metagenome TaxID=412755 RepID=A0A0F9M1L5_9ZZZZ